MTKCKTVVIPLPPNRELLSETSTSIVDITFYCKIVGKLIYLTNSQVDLAYVVGVLSGFTTHPQCNPFQAQHVL